MAEQLTPQQKMAVENRGGRLLVSAAAGSGKTKVLVDRLMSYLLDPIQPANIDDFLIITYTKAAAAELRGKIAAKLADKASMDPQNKHLQRQLQRVYLAKISTVHAFCGDILREYAYRLDLSSDFRVADEQECRQIRENLMEKILQDAYDRAGQDEDFCVFVDTQGVGRNDRQVPELVLQVYDSARCHLSPGQWLEQCLMQTATQDAIDASQTVYGRFLLQRLHGWLDMQIGALENCISRCAAYDGMQKVCDLLRDTVYQLQEMRQCDKWDTVAEKCHVDFGRLVFPKSMDDEELKEQVKAVRDGCKKGLEKHIKVFSDPSQRILADLCGSAPALRGLVGLVNTFSAEFEKVKRSRRIMDFGDLEHRTLDLLLGKDRNNPTLAAKEIGSRFREVMVDEYQDSNEVQDAIYDALTSHRKNLFMVGDVKQSIYQFRLADPGIFLQKYRRFADAEVAAPGEDRKVLLSQNFRSSAGVLAGCNDVFSMCMCPEVGGLYYGANEMLYEGMPHISLSEPEVELCCIDVREQTYPEEAAYVADRICDLLDGTHYIREGDVLRAVRAEDVVILLRSPGSAGRYYEQALSARGIRFTTGGGVDLLKTEEITALRACLQAIHNPRLDIPLIAALVSPVFCFTADALAKIRSRKKIGDFYDALLLSEDPGVKAFLSVFTQLRTCAHRESLTVLLDLLFRLTHLESIYGAMEDGEQRQVNILSFYQMAAEYEAGGNRDLGRFLEYLDSMESQGMISAGEASARGCVTIMSIHKSKGLEFPVVFLCGLGREFNMESQRGTILCHRSMGLGMFVADNEKRIRYPTIAKRAIAARIGEETLSEELRVLYVAMTRARDRLIMTYASNRLQKDLSDIVQRVIAGGKDLVIREAVCPGEWVLLTALHKTEAGELFALAGRPEETASSEHLWKISVVTAPSASEKETESEETEEETSISLETFSQKLNFRYPYPAATGAPSKMTATQRKGRIKDEEAAENTPPKPVKRQWRRPGFAPQQGREYGNALHAVMQYIDYRVCSDVAAVRNEVQRLQEQRFISAEQAEMVDCDAIAGFFATPLGEQLRQGEVIREFKFSILEDGAAYDPALAGEQVLLQGVVDCALIEPDGITVIDFKTDKVTEDNLSARVAQYRPQVEAYAQSLQKIYARKVKRTFLYFFHLGRFVEM